MREFEAKEIGQRIAQARRETGGMTQQELADLLGVTARSVQGYEQGEVTPWRHFSRLEEITKRPLSWFLHGEEAAEPTDGRELRDHLDSRFDALEARLDEIAENVRLSRAERSPTRSE